MLGIKLSFYKNDLYPVNPIYDECPLDSFDLRSLVDKDILEDRGVYAATNLKDKIHTFSLDELCRLDFDKLCKADHSTFIMMQASVKRRFEREPAYRIVNKIKNSMWRWGCDKPGWNELVDIYNTLRAFNFNNDNFEIRLDYTTYYNECGWSQYTRTYLDGTFAFIVYFKNKHVMTIGFSFKADYKLLINQVQMKNEKGNRWLYKLPKNYMEYVVDLFMQNFPKHTIYIADGKSLMNKYYSEYSNVLKGSLEALQRMQQKKFVAVDDQMSKQEEQVEYYKEKLAKLESNNKRIDLLYRNTGRFKQTRHFRENSVKFYKLERCLP